MLYYIIVYYVILYYIMLYYIMLYYIILCYIIIILYIMQVIALVAGFTDSRSSAAWKGKKDRPGCSSRAAQIRSHSIILWGPHPDSLSVPYHCKVPALAW